MGYVGLHVHTHFSLFDGIANPQEYVDRAAELGSLLETNEDIARRKAQTNNVIKSDKLNAIFTSTRISESIKIRNFNTYVDATFLFNSETWAITDA